MQEPAEQAPFEYVRSVFELAQNGGGGELQTIGWPEQTPLEQVSAAVHALPSLQETPFAKAYEQAPFWQVPFCA